MSKIQLDLLQKIYYDDGLIFGRDKIKMYIDTNYPDSKISQRQVGEWLKQQEISQLHKPHTKSKNIKSTILDKPHTQLAIDLVDFQNFQLNGYKYLLNGVDLFSRKIYSVPMKDKTDTTTLASLKKMTKKISNLQSIRSDNGAEFKNKKVKDYLEKSNISQVFSTAGNPQSNGGIERANQTLKRLIQKNIQLKDGYDWVKNIDKLTNNINETIIDKINSTPNHIEKEYAENNDEFISNIKDKDIKKKKNNISTQEFNIRDKVRIYQPSEKIKSLNWSPETYIIDKVFKPAKEYTVYEYKIKGLSTRYKEEDLQKVSVVHNKTNQPELHIVSKIIDPVVKDNKPHYKIKWKGDNQPTIEPEESLMKDIPKMVNLFNKRNKVYWYKTGGKLKFGYNDRNDN